MAGALLTPQQTADALGVSRATFYRIPWFRPRLIRVGARAVRIDPADVELFKGLRTGEPVTTPTPKARTRSGRGR